MTRNRIVGAVSALALLAAPAVAVAHGDGHHHGKKHHKHHAKKKHSRDVTGKASATITAYADGALTLALPSGKTYTADVTNRTVIICRTAPVTPATPAAKTASHGHDDGDDHGRHGHGDGGSTTTPGTTTVPASTTVPPTTHDHGNHGDHGRCGTEALVVGAKVSDAKLTLKGDTVLWKKVIVVK
jgi:hypothetical protein